MCFWGCCFHTPESLQYAEAVTPSLLRRWKRACNSTKTVQFCLFSFSPHPCSYDLQIYQWLPSPAAVESHFFHVLICNCQFVHRQKHVIRVKLLKQQLFCFSSSVLLQKGSKSHNLISLVCCLILILNDLIKCKQKHVSQIGFDIYIYTLISSLLFPWQISWITNYRQEIMFCNKYNPFTAC